MDRPEFCTDDMLEYLDDLRESGVTNMFGAALYLDEEFPGLAENQILDGRHASKESREVLIYWMETFSERHPHE